MPKRRKMEYRKGDIFESGCEAITNAVNCIGIMGAGLALQFKRRYPAMFKDYGKECLFNRIKIGKMHVWENPEGNPKYIINFPTKTDLTASELEYVTKGLEGLEETIKEKNIKSIAVPALGCGYGGLKWGQVQAAIIEFSKKLPDDVKLVVYQPL